VSLTKTTVFRLSLLFAVIFSVTASAAFLGVYLFTAEEIEDQTEYSLQQETNELKVLLHDNGIAALAATIARRDQEADRLGRQYLLFSPQGQIMAGHRSHWPANIFSLRSDQFFKTTTIRGENEYILHGMSSDFPGGYYLFIAQQLHDEEELREHSFIAILLAVTVTVIVALGGGFYMSRSVLRRIDNINHQLGSTIASGFKQRIAVAGGDEFTTLAIKLNHMLAQIDTLFAGMRQVTDNVAHDLRSPLSRIRSRLEVALLKSRSEEEYREVLHNCIEDMDNLLKTFNALLSIAQAEAGMRRQEWHTIDLVALMNDVVDYYEVLAEENGITLQWRPPQRKIMVHVNAQLLAQAVGNLLDNALKYTPQGGQIDITTDRTEDTATITVADNGPGIPAAQYQRVLKRFERLDGSRSLPGNGLGLSLVKATADMHHASLQLADNRPGLRVSLTLPI
jgi:signal transduction histidine kinase